MMNDDINNAIKERFDNYCHGTAKAIRDGDWSTVGWNIALALAVTLVAVLAVVVLAGLVITLLAKILGTLLGKIFAVPMLLLIVVFITGKVYTLFLKI